MVMAVKYVIEVIGIGTVVPTSLWRVRVHIAPTATSSIGQVRVRQTSQVDSVHILTHSETCQKQNNKHTNFVMFVLVEQVPQFWA